MNQAKEAIRGTYNLYSYWPERTPVEEGQGFGEATLSPAQGRFQVQQAPRIEQAGRIGARLP